MIQLRLRSSGKVYVHVINTEHIPQALRKGVVVSQWNNQGGHGHTVYAV